MSKPVRLGVLAGLLLIALAVAARQYVSAPRKSREPVPAAPEKAPAPPRGQQWVGSIEIVQEDVPISDPLKVEVVALPDWAESFYRLKPDRRVLYAAASIHGLTSGVSARRVTVRFEAGSWIVRVGDEDAGRIPDLASYEEARSFLVAWAEEERQRHGFPESPATTDSSGSEKPLLGAPSAQVLEDLARLDELWKGARGSRDLAKRGCRGLTWLAVQSFDPLDRTDPLFGKALALLYLLPPDPSWSAADEALLAGALGYEAAARRAAAGLPEGDTVRRWVTSDDLRREIAGQDPFASYFGLRDRAEARDREGFAELVGTSPWASATGLESFALAMRAADFSQQMGASVALASEAWRTVVKGSDGQPAAPPPPAEMGGKLAEFESALKQRTSSRKGPILDADVEEGYFRAHFYGGLYEQARFYFDSLSSTPAAEELSNSFVQPPPGTAEELASWISLRVGIRKNDPKSRQRLATSFASFGHLGASPVGRLRTSMKFAFAGEDRQVRTGVRGLFDALDARPAGRIEAANAADESLQDLLLKEKFARSAVREAPRAAGPWTAVVARNDNDRAALNGLARDPRQPTAVRLESIRFLGGLEKQGATALTDLFWSVAESNPQDTWPIRYGVWFLTLRNETRAALELVNRWLIARPQQRDLGWAGVVADKSLLLRKLGRYSEAWEVIEPAAGTWKQDCMNEAARVLAAQKNLNDALAMASRAAERYPEGPESWALLAEIHWMRREPEEAANAVKKGLKMFVGGQGGKHLGPAFAVVFAGGDRSAAVAAFDLLLSSGLPVLPDLLQVAQYVLGRNDRPLAQAMFRRIPQTNADRTKVNLIVFGGLCDVEGEEKALEWLREREKSFSDELVVSSYQNRLYDVLWELLPEGASVQNRDVLAVVRAMALVQTKSAPGPRREALVADLQRLPSDSFFANSARYLTGLIPAPELFPPTLTRSLWGTSSAGWFYGIKAASEGRLEEAARWFRVSLEAGDFRIPPYAWSFELLLDWNRTKLFLAAAIAKEGLNPKHTWMKPLVPDPL